MKKGKSNVEYTNPPIPEATEKILPGIYMRTVRKVKNEFIPKVLRTGYVGVGTNLLLIS